MFSNLLKKFTQKNTQPEEAYDVWAKDYDQQPENLMLTLDEIVFSILLKNIVAENKTIVDVGCGTGRHWKLLFDQHPGQLTGYDVSEGMLEVLAKKFPKEITYKLAGNHLAQNEDSSADLVISTLTMAHIKDIKSAMSEWDRVAKTGADIIITDYHPDILQKGGKRTFKSDDKVISVKNYVHHVSEIKSIATQLGWNLENQLEKKVDASVKHFYEKQNALKVFEAYQGMPVIYGLHFRKAI